MTIPSRDRAAAPAAPPAHLGYLDGLRGAAAVYVMLHHILFNMTVADPGAHVLQRLLRLAFSAGSYAVDLFITLSGFCLMLWVVQGKYRSGLDFVKRRALRILPPYYAAMALALAINAAVIADAAHVPWKASLEASGFDIVTHVLMVSEWWHDSAKKINFVFWSIGVEWKIYLIFPLLVLLWRRVGNLGLVLVTVPGTYLLWLGQSQLQLLNPLPQGSSVYYVGLFCVGMAAAAVRAEALFASARAAAAGRALMLLLAAALPVSLFIYIRQGDHPSPLHNILGGCATAWLLVCLRGGLLPRTQALLSRGPLVWSGTIGYSIYLLHMPLALVFAVYAFPPQAYHAPLPLLLMVLAVSGTCLAAARAFYQLAELPAHRWSRGGSAGRRPAAAAGSAAG